MTNRANVQFSNFKSILERYFPLFFLTMKKKSPYKLWWRRFNRSIDFLLRGIETIAVLFVNDSQGTEEYGRHTP